MGRGGILPDDGTEDDPKEDDVNSTLINAEKDVKDSTEDVVFHETPK